MTWQEIWHDLGTASGDQALHERLKACWSEPHRHYHTLQHLDECLSQLARVRSRAERPAEIEIALWFHDAIYDPRREDNEVRSADWAHNAVRNERVRGLASYRIYSLVLATGHTEMSMDPDTQILIVIDLSIPSVQ